MTSEAAATSFDAWATDYDRYRPGYPPALFDAIASAVGLPERPRIADLGAGTGLASLAMAERGWEVVAVEPGAAMLQVLAGRADEAGVAVETIEAPAEATTLPTASIDLVTAAQAFHWFDRPRAVAEMARILRPGGGIALFWNVRDATRSALVADYERLIEERFGAAGIGQYLQYGREAEDAATRAAFDGAPFEDLERTEPRQERTVSAEDFVGMAFTASYVRNLPDGEQAALRDRLYRLLERHGVIDAPFTIPYRIDLWTAKRSDR